METNLLTENIFLLEVFIQGDIFASVYNSLDFWTVQVQLPQLSSLSSGMCVC